jgi:hypothetical protein
LRSGDIRTASAATDAPTSHRPFIRFKLLRMDPRRANAAGPDADGANASGLIDSRRRFGRSKSGDVQDRRIE